MSLLASLLGGDGATDLSGVDVNAPEKDPVHMLYDPVNPRPQNMDFVQQPQGQITPPQESEGPAPVTGGTPQTPAPPGLNYDNSAQIDAIQNANGLRKPQGGSTNPGIYGLLPDRLQHGTLRNILGALGDAFLVGHGDAPQYGPRMERQAMGNAIAGMDPNDPDSMTAALHRLAGTGAPGSMEMVQQLQKQMEEAASRRATLEQNAWYKDATMSNRHDMALQRMLPYIGGMMAGANSPESYAAAYSRAEAIAQRIGNEYHASDFGLVDPQDWQPGQPVQGLTGNNIVQSGDRAAGRATSERNTDVNAGSRIQAAEIGAGSRERTAALSNSKATNATILESLIEKRNRGESLTPAEQSTFDHMTTVPQGRAGRQLPPGLAVRGGTKPASGGGGSYPTLTRSQALIWAKVPGNKGKKFRLEGSSELQSFH